LELRHLDPNQASEKILSVSISILVLVNQRRALEAICLEVKKIMGPESLVMEQTGEQILVVVWVDMAQARKDFLKRHLD